MRLSVLLGLLGLLVVSTARANSCAVTLILDGVSGYGATEYFDSDDDEPMPADVATLHRRLVDDVLVPLADFFKKTPGELFPELEVTFRASAMGPLASAEGELGVFPFWSPSEGVVDPFVLGHEIVHGLVSDPRKHGLPPVLKELQRSFTFNEFIADWVPYQAFGRERLGIPTLPGLPMRHVDLVSYDLPAGRFSGERTTLSLHRWLAQIHRKPSRSREEQSLLDHALAEGFEPDVPLPSDDSLDPRPLEALGNEVRHLDAHHLGMPLFILLRDFEDRIGHDVRDTFFAALDALDRVTVTDQTFDTYLAGYRDHRDSYVRVVVKRPRHFFAEFRKLLPPGERAIFDELYGARAIEKGLRLEDSSYLENHVRLEATELMRDRFRANGGRGTGIYTQDNPYFHPDYGIANAKIELIPVGS